MRRVLATVLVVGLVPVAASCRTAAQVHPRAMEHNDSCVKYIDAGELERAERRCELALEFNPDYPEPYGNLCLLEIRRGNLDKAKKLCIRALRLNQDFAEAHNNLGNIYLQQEAPGKACDEFAAALRINPDFVAARYNRALCLRKLKKPDEARRELIKLAESQPNLADPHLELGALALDDGDANEALKECIIAARLDAKYAAAHFCVGNALMKLGKFCEASEAYKECLGADKDNIECRQNIAQSNRRCALVDPSLREVKDQAVTEGTGVSFYKAAVAQLDKGLVADAERNLKKCIKAETPVADCFCLLAKLAHDDARPEDETKYCKKCLKNTASEHVSEQTRSCEKLLGEQGDF